MKKLLIPLLVLLLGITAFGQQKIQLRSVDKAECVSSDMKSLKASFSFSGVEATDVVVDRGTFSWLSMANTVIGGNLGEPQLPVVNELIAVPFGATPRVEITNFSSTDYRLEDYGMKTLVPRQLPVRKDQNLEEAPFVLNEAAYQNRGLRSEPQAVVSVDGTMRGVQLGTMTIEPVSYDPVNNTVRVFNDIEVEVHFDGADVQATEDMLLRTYSPAFDNVYAQLFNNRAITDVYTDHPDLYNTPVKMLVICYSGFKNNDALNSWLQWKLQKGYYVDIHYTDETGTTANAIATFIKNKYNASVSAGNAYTYLIVIGDTGQVPQYMTKNIDSDIGNCASDLGYASVNFSSSTSNYFPDMYYSRISVENTTHLTNYINKVLTYEKYEFTDGGNYLNNVILVGGWDSSWTPKVAKPTINYGTNNYFKSSNTTYGGFENGTIEATVSTSSTAGYAGTATGTSTTMGNGVYTSINSGVGFLNYTAHGDKQEWYQPKMTAAQVANLTNAGKYFFGVGNCCLTGNFNNTTTTYSPGSAIGTNACFAETMIRVPNAGAVAYVGCSPYSYWYEDFYWAVGAHSYSQGNAPSVSGSTKGVYDVMFMDQYWNSASALLYLGNLAVQQAVTNGNTNSSVTDGNCNNSAHYYFQFYHCFGDGSVMPYVTKPETNTVTNMPATVTPGTTSITLNAEAGSYVAVTDNSSKIYGVAEANSSGVATVNFTESIPGSGTLYVVITRQQYQPYFGTIEVVGGTQYTINATANPSNGGTVQGAGQYYGNTECTLTATPATHYAFDNWKLNNAVVSTEPSYTFTVNGNANYTANFHALTQHHLTYNPQQTHGTISVSPTNAYAGDIVTLTAIPAAGYCLHAWHVTTGRAEIPVVNNQFEMPDSDVTVTAEFGEGFTVTLAPVMNGTISADKTECAPGETVTLTALPATGYDFNGWVVYKTGDINTTVTVEDGTFVMPSFDVTVSAVFSQPSGNLEVTIGSGTSTSAYLPTYAYYKYSLSQQIYSHGEMGCAGTITKVAFKVSNSKSTTRTLDIYMSHTSNTSFESTSSWEAQNTANRVYSGSVTFSASGWTVITLQTPFEYDGTSNLLLTVDDNTGSYVSSSSDAPSFYVYSAIGNTALYKYSDNTNYNPASMTTAGTQLSTNNQVIFTKEVPNAGYLSVSPNALTGFSYMQGQGPSESKVATVVVNADNDVTVTAPQNYEVSLTSNGTYSNTLTIPVSSKGGRGTQTWDFEGDLLDWTTIDSDGDGYNWQVRETYGYNSDYSVTSESYHNNESGSGGTALNPDNWLVSPQVILKGVFSFWAQAQDASWAAEHFGVYVSTTSNTNTNSFVKLDEWTLAAKKGVSYTKRGGGRAIGTWYQYSVDLSAYAGQTGYIAIRHFDCTDMFAMNVDYITLGDTPVVPISGNLVTTNVYVRLQEGLDPDNYSGNMTFVSGNVNAAVSLNGEVLPGSGEQYTITVEASPANGGTVEGGGTFYEGSSKPLTATPATHYTFTGWQLNGSIVSTDNPYTITVTGDATYTAIFEEMPQYTVTVTQVEGGTITANPTTAYPGDVITLSVTTQSGFFLTEWNVVDGNNQPITVTNNEFTMPSSNVTVTATFSQGFSVTLNQTPNGTISADQTTMLQPGDIVTLTATPDANCILKTWYVFKTGDPRALIAVVNNSYFTMPASDVTVMAVFVTTEQFEATVGSGTSTNNYIPTYVRSKYSLTEQIYLASDLSYKAGSITKIAFRATTASATRNLIIYMRPTTKSSFSSTTDWETMGAVYKVFEGSVTFGTSDWTTITLDTPFEYDGTSNINLCVVDESNATTGNNWAYTKFYRTDATNRALYAYGNSSYASSVGFSNSLSSVTGTRISYVNRVNFTMTVPGSAESLTVSPGAMDDFSYEEGQGPSNTHKLDIVGVDLQNNVTLTAPTNFEMSLDETGTYTSSLTVNRETGSKGNREVTIWDFDNGFQSWTAVDADNDGSGWVLGSAIGGVYLEEGGDLTGQGHNDSNDLLVSGSYSNVNGVLTPDNWVISPQVELGGTFSLWTAALDDSYFAEHFGIFVSTTNTNTSSFTMLNEWTLSSADWHQYSVDLSAYAGQQGYIAVRHFSCTDMFCLLMDDFELDTDATITIEMPVTITPATVYVRMKDNLAQGSYSGTLTATAGTGDHLNGTVSLSGEVLRPTATQAVSLVEGWNWWTPTVADADLNAFKANLDSRDYILTAQNVAATSLVPGQLYKVWVNSAHSFSLSGYVRESVQVTFTSGSLTYFGFIGVSSVEIGEALGGITPSEGDMINSLEDGFAIYHNGVWEGTLTSLESGYGYVYLSREGDKTVTF